MQISYDDVWILLLTEKNLFLAPLPSLSAAQHDTTSLIFIMESVKNPVRSINFLRFLITNAFRMGKCEIYSAFNNASSSIQVMCSPFQLFLYSFIVRPVGSALFDFRCFAERRKCYGNFFYDETTVSLPEGGDSKCVLATITKKGWKSGFNKATERSEIY